MVTSTTTGLCLRIWCSGKRTLHQQRPQKERNMSTKYEIVQENETKEVFELMIINENKILCSKKVASNKSKGKNSSLEWIQNYDSIAMSIECVDDLNTILNSNVDIEQLQNKNKNIHKIDMIIMVPLMVVAVLMVIRNP